VKWASEAQRRNSKADGDLRVEEEQEYGTYTDRTVTVTYDLPGRIKSLG